MVGLAFVCMKTSWLPVAEELRNYSLSAYIISQTKAPKPKPMRAKADSPGMALMVKALPF